MNLEMKNALNHRKTAYKKYTVKERFTPLLSAAFPHLSCEGALHVFKFELWKNSINDFGGVPIVSLGEDILFYKNCMSKMGEKFKSDQIKIEKPSLLKIDDGHNASVLEWTYDLSESDIPQWCKYYVALIDKVSRSKNNTELNEYFAKISKAFLTSGEIKWY